MTFLLLVAALAVGDGSNTRPECTSFTYNSATGALTLAPPGCIGAPPPAPAPVETTAMFDALVTATYVQFLGRQPDAQGLAFWTKWLFDSRANPASKQLFLDAMYNSPEAAAYRLKTSAPPQPTVPGGVTAAQFFNPPMNMCGSPCGGVPVPVSTCGSGMGAQITNAYQLNLLGDFFATFPKHTEHIAMPKGHVLSLVFNTGARPASCSAGNPGCLYGFNQSYSNSMGLEAPTFISVSTTRCDFDYAKVNTANGCYRSIGGGENGVTTRFGPAGMPPDGSCELQPNTNYYVNIRWENAGAAAGRGKESCGAAQCGMALDFR